MYSGISYSQRLHSKLFDIRNFTFGLLLILLFQLFIPTSSYLESNETYYFVNRTLGQPILAASFQSSNLKIVGAGNDPNPVVNEGKQAQLTVIDTNGQPVSGATFESGSPEIARVDPQTGIITGLQRGYSTVTARVGNQSISAFVVVARVASGKGMKVMGDTKVDTSGAIYLSDPVRNIILKRSNLASAAVTTFAGKTGTAGKDDGEKLTEATFRGPIGVAIDNRAEGGIYIADTLNHSVRRIGFNNQVETVIGDASPGTNRGDETPFNQAKFNSPQGVALAAGGGTLYIADTNNHTIYAADLQQQKVKIVAGEPGVSGRTDGNRREAKFNRPTAITISSGGGFSTGSQPGLLVADSGNNRICFVTFDGKVSTVGRNNRNSSRISTEQAADGFFFDFPQSISTDNLGNIYVVDRSGVKVVTQTTSGVTQIVSLAQPTISFGQAVSITVRSNQSFVLDTNATTEDEAVKVVTVGAPEIQSLSRNSDRLEGGIEVVVTGRNFAPESQVVLGDQLVDNLTVESATRIRFRVPRQDAPGRRTLSVRTRGGTAQEEFIIFAKPLSELAKGEITTITGGVKFLGDGGKALNSRIAFEQFLSSGIAVDGDGNLFISDISNSRIRKLDTTGIITTVAGNGIKGFGGDGQLAVGARLDRPRSIALDGDGNIFIADQGNARVRRVDNATGIITTVAGNGRFDFSGDGGLAIDASFTNIVGVAVDKNGNLFIADRDNRRVRRVDAITSIITTVAGGGNPSDGKIDGRLATDVALLSPSNLTFDQDGNLFIVDIEPNTSFGAIRRVDAETNIITTVAGGGNPLSGIGDGGSATSARLFLPTAVVVDTLGNLLIADAVHGRIRFVNLKTGIINSLAGGGNPEDGIGDDRPATDAAIEPMGLAVDGVGNIFIADMRSKTVRAVNAEGFITRVAGNGATNFGGDGQLAIAATLDTPNAVAIDRSGNIYIEDANNRRVRKIDASSLLISTVAGGGNPRDGLGDGGSPTDASFSIFGAIISGLVLDKDNNIIISDIFNARVRKIDFTGNRITTVAGNGQFSSTGESVPATEAAIGRPTGLAFDSQANLYIADTSENRPAIRRVSAADSRIQTVVGGGSRQSGDGLPATAVRLKSVASVAVDLDGNIYVVDPADSRVRRVDAKTGIIDAYAGDGGFGSSGDGGLAKDANLSFPISATVDSAGNLYISDIGTQSVRRVDAKTRIITTVAGIGVSGYIGDGSIATRAALADPAGLAVDSNGNLYIADSSNGAIRVVKGIGQQQIDIQINNVSFNKPQLLISGAGFGNSGARVLINGQDLSSSINSQSDSSIVVKGNKKKLFLKKGANQITVTNSSNSSASFVFNF